MGGKWVKMKEPIFVIFCFTNFHHQTFSLYILRMFSFSFALWMCNFMLCYLTFILTTVSREATSQQFPKSLKHISRIRLTLLCIYDIFASHGIILHLSHTTNPHVYSLSRPVRPCLKLPLFTSLAHIAACYAHTQVWSDLRTRLKWSGQSIFALQGPAGRNHAVLMATLTLVVFFASRKLVPFSLFLSLLPIY